MEQEILILCFLLFAACSIVVFFFLRTFRRIKRERLALRRIEANFGARKTEEGWCVEGDDFIFQFSLRHNFLGFGCWGTGRPHGSWLEISTLLGPGVSFTLRKKKFLDRFWAGGKFSPVPTGDKEFDREFVIVSADRSFARDYFSFEKRSSVRTLFAEGFDLLVCRSGRISAVRRVASPRELGAPLVFTAATELQILTRNVPVIEKPAEIAKQKVLQVAAVILIALLAFGCYVFVAFDVLDPYEIGFLAFLAALPAAGLSLWLFAPALFSIIPGIESSARVRLVPAYCSILVVLTIALFGSFVAINCGPDQSPERIVTAIVIDKQINRAFGIEWRTLAVLSWRFDESLEFIRVKDSDFEDPEPALDCLSLLLRDGTLGFPWVESYRVVSGDLDAACNSQRSALLSENTPPELPVEIPEPSPTPEPEFKPAVSAAMNLDEAEEKKLKVEPLHGEFERYYYDLMRKILDRWPWEDTSRDLAASFSARLDSSGRLRSLKMVQSSGDGEFDTSALKALKDAQPLPPPGAALLPYFREIRFTFDSRMEGAQEVDSD